MNQIIEQIADLRRYVSYMNFGPDYDCEQVQEAKKQIKELEQQIKGVTLVAMAIKFKGAYSYDYLTSDSHLCFGNEPTWFDSKEEAMQYFKAAELHKENIEYEFIEKTF